MASKKSDNTESVLKKERDISFKTPNEDININNSSPQSENTQSEQPTESKKERKEQPNDTKINLPTTKKLVSLFSRLQNPVYVTYGESVITIPPRGIVRNLNPEMLGILPNGIDKK